MIFLTLGLAALLVVLDQISKLYIVKNFSLGEIKDFISIAGHKIISITHIRNSGAAWSILEGKTLLLIIFPIIILAFMMYLLFAKKIHTKFEYISVALVIAGGIGNLIDRVRLHEVVDFIKWEVFEFPIFNLADIFVVIGAIMLCVFYMFFDEESKRKNLEIAVTEKEETNEQL